MSVQEAPKPRINRGAQCHFSYPIFVDREFIKELMTAFKIFHAMVTSDAKLKTLKDN